MFIFAAAKQEYHEKKDHCIVHAPLTRGKSVCPNAEMGGNLRYGSRIYRS